MQEEIVRHTLSGKFRFMYENVLGFSLTRAKVDIIASMRNNDTPFFFMQFISFMRVPCEIPLQAMHNPL